MSSSDIRPLRCAVLSIVKHDYIPRGVLSHPRFELTVVADDPENPGWVHDRNQKFADEFEIPYVRSVEQALREFDVQVAIVSSEAERHCDLSIRAANAGLHVVQDKPMSSEISQCDRLVEAVERNNVRFLMWNRNFLPAVEHARQIIASGDVGEPRAIHVDFYFSKDAGPPKGSRSKDDPPIDWLTRQIEAHADGSDGGVGHKPLGELAVEGIYPLAYIRALTGAEVERVFARTSSFFHQAHADNEVEDMATVSLEMERSMVASICLGRIGAASHPDLGEIKLHVIGTRGGVVISEARPEISVHYRGQDQTEFRNRRIGMDDAYQLMEEFAAAIDEDRPTMLDARASRAICATVEAAVTSGRTGNFEKVPR